MQIEWQNDLILGIPEIDEQHQEIFRRFAAFSAASEANPGKETMLDMITFMDLYARQHFAREEQIMAEYGYPGLHEQELHHAQFQHDLEEFADRINSEGVSPELILSVKGKLVRWLIQHIREMDRDMVRFVKGAPGGIGNPGPDD